MQIVDDNPLVVNDTATTNEVVGDVNAAFILDFSGSVNNTELNQMLTAVEDAITELFNGTSGDVTITLIAFSHGSPSSGALTYGPFTTLGSVIDQLEDLNPADGGSRPYSGRTNFSAAVNEAIVACPHSSTSIVGVNQRNRMSASGFDEGTRNAVSARLS